MIETAHILVNAYLNDPGEKDLKVERVSPSASVSRFAIQGYDGGSIDAKPGTIEFQRGQLAETLSEAYDLWTEYFGSSFDWQPGPTLPIVPRAGRDFNAYYDRTALKFFYNTDSKTQQTIYTAESCDVIAHECGHAVLDAHHPDYWDSLHPETGAFHEAFGDISSLLTTLKYPSVRTAILKETRGDLAKSNGISRVAEQLGRALFDEYGKDVSPPDALRDLVNKFRFVETWKLPARAPASKLSSESHSFSRIFSGAFYEILVGIYNQRRKENPTLSQDDALVAARDEAGGLLAEALLLAPPGDGIFKVIATSMVKADQQKFASRNFPVLRKVFSSRRILKVRESDVFKPHTRTEQGKIKSISAGTLSAEGVDTERLPPEVLNKALRLRGEELTFARELARRQERAIQYRTQKSVRLKGKQYGPADGALIPLQDGLVLNVDVAGIVAASHFYRSGASEAKAVRDHVQKLAARDRIYDSRPGDEVDLMHLITRRQPYYISYDASGNKVVRRAFIACGCFFHEHR